ncbi:hypothetical protein OFN29_33115, partial [Escherichia coli]|nr:hypothetical protein [Escherichia coli]
ERLQARSDHGRKDVKDEHENERPRKKEEGTASRTREAKVGNLQTPDEEKREPDANQSSDSQRHLPTEELMQTRHRDGS